MIDAIRNAAALGACGAVLGLAMHFPRGWMLIVPGGLAAAGIALEVGSLGPGWALESLARDAPWGMAAAIAAWSAVASGGWLRLDGWLMTVVLAGLFGDRLAALGLAGAVGDPARRARLVLAASGVSMVGPVGGAAALGLGAGGWEVAALGLGCALVGFSPTVGRAGVIPAQARRAALRVGLVTLGGAAVVWLMVLGGAPDLVAYAIEHLPTEEPTLAPLLVGGGAAVAGLVADESVAALFAREILLDARSLRGDWAREAMLVGISLGGGLPMLLLTRSRLAIGLPLWLVQLALGAGFLWSRRPEL